MADTSSISISTAQWVKNSPYITLSVTKTGASNSTSYTYDWKLTYTAKYAASTSQNRSYSVTIGGFTSSGTFPINNKTGTHTIASGTRTIQRTQSTQTIAASASFAFNLTWSGVYAGTKSVSKNITIDPKPSYTVTYNLAGGIGTFNNQKKWYGVDLTLHTAKPSRTGYNFLGWLANNTGSVLATYTKNAAATMYAKWEQSLQKPTITNLVIRRCTSDGTVDEVNGTYAKATFDWSVDPSVSLVSLTVGGVSQQIPTESHVETAPINGGFSTDHSYDIDVVIEDSKRQKLTVTGTLSSSKYPIDFHAGGNGVTIGSVAETAGFKIAMDFVPMTVSSTTLNANYISKIHESNNSYLIKLAPNLCCISMTFMLKSGVTFAAGTTYVVATVPLGWVPNKNQILHGSSATQYNNPIVAYVRNNNGKGEICVRYGVGFSSTTTANELSISGLYFINNFN